ncbi:MAG: DUF2147 domain-containing protein [Terriglobales bacterium]|jgi:uncharacterized protein (DUF2147 family)
MKIALFLLLVLVLVVTPGFAASDDIVGVWLDTGKDAKIQIFKCGQKYCGKIVWLIEPRYPANSPYGPPGQNKVDRSNPDPALRKTPLLDLQMMRDFEYDGAGLWKNGTVYDPDNGKTYSARMTMDSPNQLNLRGYIAFSIFGRTEVWTRTN